ncbi:DNA polymerase III subunit gamma/tau [Orrella marina]|uniref:DNA polymerase III subunit gamma/tau n=1 Tax=Orrella marina TaxID=2163011 RepID=A0A2R4XNB3_9BURK|nr:DNA polymerase III subunit gamma/tau [Orrella marina]AWB35297.1 DNA polymerase III, subunit gamma and tau [Orrella marina]
MSYLVLARKWRPRDFESLVGQDHVVRALTHALTTQRLHHAWLFTGTRGVGKTTLSRILAKSLNCEAGITAHPCGKCAACTQIDAGRFVDYVELDAASNRGVDEMTQLLEQAVYAPTAARFKVYMIDEVHMLSGHAFNAMLKTLEEPPPHVKFILATTDPQKIPPTVLSRCLQFNLKQMAPESIASHLAWVLEQENVRFESLALRLIGQSASGSMRDALSLTDQAIAFSSGDLTLESVRSMLGSVDQTLLVQLLQSLYQCDAPQVLEVTRRLSERGLSLRAALADLAILLSRIAITQRVGTCELEDETVRDAVQHLANEMPADLVQLFYTVCVHSRQELAQAPDEFAGFVMICLRMLGFVDSLVDPQKKSAPLKTSQPVESSKPTGLASTAENTERLSAPASGSTVLETPDSSTTPADPTPSLVAATPVHPVPPSDASEQEKSAEDFVGVAIREAKDTQLFRQDAPAPGKSNDQARLSSGAGLTDPSDLQSGVNLCGRKCLRPAHRRHIQHIRMIRQMHHHRSHRLMMLDMMRCCHLSLMIMVRTVCFRGKMPRR